MDDKKLALHEWAVIFMLLSSIVAVLIVGGVKRQVIKGKVYKSFILEGKKSHFKNISQKEKDFIVEKSSLLICCPPMNHSSAYRK
jgi:hypothetical protein